MTARFAALKVCCAICAVAWSLGAPCADSPGALPVAAASSGIHREIRYVFTVENLTGKPIGQAEFWTYAPVGRTSTQQLAKLSASQPYEQTEDALGNEILHFRLDTLPPYGTRIISITAKLLLSATPTPQTINPNDFIRPARFIESDAPKIARLAQQLKGETPLETARQVYDWIVSDIHSQGYIAQDKGALWALDNHMGDCTEFADLFVALLRANGIPARTVGGYVYGENAVAHATDYHDWAEFYWDGAWQVADPQARVFMKDPSRYIAMQIISDQVKNPMGPARRYTYKGAGLRIGMR